MMSLPEAGGYRLPFFFVLSSPKRYRMCVVPASDYLGIAFLFHDRKKGEKKVRMEVQYLHVTLAGERMGDARITGDLPSMQKMFAIR